MNENSYAIEKSFKYFLLILSSICLIGITMVYSSSYIYAKEFHGSSAYYFNKQIIFLLISIIMAFVVYKTKITFWLKYGTYINALAVALLGLTLIPGLGINIKGASRWLQIGPVGLQPSELVKYTVLLASIPFFDDFFSYTRKQKIIFGLLIALPLCFLLWQPDFGSFTICLIVLGFVCFFSSFPRKYFYGLIISGVMLIIPILISQPYRVRRLFAYLDPWKNARTSGFQIIQSYLAFANGSIFGQGLGNSNEKLFYLPEAHNDFIFSVIGEELGFLGVSIIIGLFVLLIYFGFKLCLTLEKRRSFILVASIISTLGLQIFLNMGVVLGLLPTKGLNLPFISAGGSSLIANFFAIGLIASAIHEQKRKNSYLDNTNGHFSDSYSSNNSYINSSLAQNEDPYGQNS